MAVELIFWIKLCLWWGLHAKVLASYAGQTPYSGKHFTILSSWSLSSKKRAKPIVNQSNASGRPTVRRTLTKQIDQTTKGNHREQRGDLREWCFPHFLRNISSENCVDCIEATWPQTDPPPIITSPLSEDKHPGSNWVDSTHHKPPSLRGANADRRGFISTWCRTVEANYIGKERKTTLKLL